MKVLVISNKADVTSDFIIKNLKTQGIDYYRLNTEDLFKSIQCNFKFDENIFELYDSNLDLTVDLIKIKSVYYRRPELPTVDEQELEDGERKFILNEYIFFLEGVYKILKNALWVNSVEAVRNAENKIYQLQIAKEIGFAIPKSLISSYHSECLNFIESHKNDCIVKPIKSGLVSDGIDGNDKVVFTNHINSAILNNADLNHFPNYIQEHIHKKGDIRVTVVGNKIFAAFIDSQKDDSAITDWRSTSSSLEHKSIILPDPINRKCIEITKRLKLVFSAIDLILDEQGDYIFLEINPNGQWAWIETRLGYQISKEITNVLANVD